LAILDVSQVKIFIISIQEVDVA